jgi:hypothetical protein
MFRRRPTVPVSRSAQPSQGAWRPDGESPKQNEGTRAYRSAFHNSGPLLGTGWHETVSGPSRVHSRGRSRPKSVRVASLLSCPRRFDLCIDRSPPQHAAPHRGIPAGSLIDQDAYRELSNRSPKFLIGCSLRVPDGEQHLGEGSRMMCPRIFYTDLDRSLCKADYTYLLHHAPQHPCPRQGMQPILPPEVVTSH